MNTFGREAHLEQRALWDKSVAEYTEKLKAAAAQRTRWWRFTIERDGRLMRQMLRY